MSLMDNPMNALLAFQQELNAGMPVNNLDASYVFRNDEYNGGKRYSYAIVIDGEVQALATFGQEEPINGVDCYSVNYYVNEKHRGRGLAVEVVNKGIKELRNDLALISVRKFIVDAIIDVTNVHSIRVAEKLFPGPGKTMKDYYTGVPSLYFRKLIDVN